MRLSKMRKLLWLLILFCGGTAFFLRPVTASGGNWTCTIKTPRPERKGKVRSPAKGHLWIPAGVERLRGLLVAGKISLEKRICTDPRIREACKEEGMGILYYEPHIASVFPYAKNNCGELFLESLASLAEKAGHPEIKNIPWLTVGHSTGGIFCRNVAYWKPERVIGVLHVKSGNFQDHIQDPAGTLAGVPFLSVNGEFERYGPAGGDLKGGKRSRYSLHPTDKTKLNQTQWVMIRMQMIERRLRNGDNLMSLVVHRGGGHGDWSDKLSKIAAQFIRSAAEVRLPGKGGAGSGKKVLCKPVTAADGWLTDADIKAPRYRPAPYRDYKGDKRRAFWHINGALARMIYAYHKGPWKQADPTAGMPPEKRYRPPKVLQDQVDMLFTRSLPDSKKAVVKEAEERIRSHRTGDLTVKVKSEGGIPVGNLKVTVKQISHDFLFGCNIYALGRLGNPKRENRYRTYFQEIFNYATLPFYWASFEPRQGSPRYERVETMAEWCEERQITVKGHPLVWNHPAGVPDWLPGETKTVRELLYDRVKKCVRYFHGSVEMWDVVNEAADPFRFREKRQISHVIKEIGKQKYLWDAFSAARAANPEAFLLINDYRTGEKYKEVIKLLRCEDGYLCDAIGIQSHMHGGVWPVKRMHEVCERFSAFELPLHFTETTLVSGPRRGGRWQETEPALEKRQARQAALFYTVLFSRPSVTALTWWDFADTRAWQGAAAGFLRKDCTPKPVYHTLYRLIKEKWWTEKTVACGKEGKIELPAFFGKYKVIVRDKPGSKIKEKQFEFKRPWPPPLKKRASKTVNI